MKTGGSLIVTAILIANVPIAVAQEHKSDSSLIENFSVGSAVVYQTALSRPDLAVAKSMITTSRLKGDLGEAIHDQTIGRYFRETGRWYNVSPRLESQGLDHVSIKLDENGNPVDLMVDETKFGSSRLGKTKYGIQMGGEWISHHLNGLASRYDEIWTRTEAGEVLSAKMPENISPKQVIRIPLRGSKSVVFWRKAGGWNYDGPPELFGMATSQLKKISTLFRNASAGWINFRKRIFVVEIIKTQLFVSILKADNVDEVGGRLSGLETIGDLPPFELSGKENWGSKLIRQEIKNELSRKFPSFSPSEIDGLSTDIQNRATAQDAIKSSSFRRFSGVQAGEAGVMAVGIAVPIEIVSELVGDSHIDWRHVSGVGVLAGGSALAGSITGNVIARSLMRTEFGGSVSTQAASLLGLRSSSVFSNLAGSMVGGGVTDLLFAYGGYWLGHYDLRTANRSAVAGAAGMVTGGAVAGFVGAGEGSVFSVEAALGAGEGPPGWIAAGIAMAATAPVLLSFHLYDEKQDATRLTQTIGYLSTKRTFPIPVTQ